MAGIAAAALSGWGKSLRSELSIFCVRYKKTPLFCTIPKGSPKVVRVVAHLGKVPAETLPITGGEGRV
jgi:hypothetical protein